MRPHLGRIYFKCFGQYLPCSPSAYKGILVTLALWLHMVTAHLLEAFPSYKLNMYILNGTPRTSFEPRRFFASWTWIRLTRETQALVQDLFTCTWTPPRSPL